MDTTGVGWRVVLQGRTQALVLNIAVLAGVALLAVAPILIR